MFVRARVCVEETIISASPSWAVSSSAVSGFAWCDWDKWTERNTIEPNVVCSSSSSSSGCGAGRKGSISKTVWRPLRDDNVYRTPSTHDWIVFRRRLAVDLIEGVLAPLQECDGMEHVSGAEAEQKQSGSGRNFRSPLTTHAPAHATSRSAPAPAPP